MATSEIAKAKFAALDEVGEEEIFEQIASGVSMREMCRRMSVGHKLWYRWIDRADGRRQRYEVALMEAAHFYADRAVQTAQMTDPATVNADRLKVDTDKWIASKLNQQYDTRQKDVAINISVNDLHAQAAQLLGDVIDLDAEDVTDYGDEDDDSDEA
jgi:hypothetical protein